MDPPSRDCSSWARHSPFLSLIVACMWGTFSLHILGDVYNKVWRTSGNPSFNPPLAFIGLFLGFVHQINCRIQDNGNSMPWLLQVEWSISILTKVQTFCLSQSSYSLLLISHVSVCNLHPLIMYKDGLGNYFLTGPTQVLHPHLKSCLESPS